MSNEHTEMLNKIKARVEQALKAQGVSSAEFTFVTPQMFSVLVNNRNEFEVMKGIFKAAEQEKVDEAEHEEEALFVAYYNL